MPKKPSASGGMSRSTTFSSTSSTSTLGRKPQVLSGRYVDEQKLRDYLNKRWGAGQYALDVSKAFFPHIAHAETPVLPTIRKTIANARRSLRGIRGPLQALSSYQLYVKLELTTCLARGNARS